MSKENEKVTLTLTNAIDIQGEMLSLNQKLPVDNNSKITLPENLVAVDVIDENKNILFSIYVGKKSNIEELLIEMSLNRVMFRKDLNIDTIETPICFHDIDDLKVIFALVKEKDIVVKDIAQLKEVIHILSDECKTYDLIDSNKVLCNLKK